MGRHSAQLIERLLADRIVLLTEPIDDEVAHYLLAQLLFLMDRDDRQPISLYIDSPGGTAIESLAIIDTIAMSNTPIHTTCVGFAAGTALLILACGAKGKRRAVPHALLEMTSLAFDFSSLSYAQIEQLEDIVNRFAVYCSAPEEKIRLAMDEETVLDAYEAIEYGLVDGIAKICS